MWLYYILYIHKLSSQNAEHQLKKRICHQSKIDTKIDNIRDAGGFYNLLIIIYNLFIIICNLFIIIIIYLIIYLTQCEQYK